KNMKKQLFFIRNNKGFVFPYLLFIVTLLLIGIQKQIVFYENEIEMTELMVDQVKIETMYQMAKTETKNELAANPHIRSIIFHYPYGEAEVTLQPESETAYKARFVITTFPNNNSYTFISQILHK
ncbi:MAG TPA: hypothetical protein VK057_09455, partial [Bacillota bacterium]|nr:hypothetical protein [Bacillota bacterium]